MTVRAMPWALGLKAGPFNLKGRPSFQDPENPETDVDEKRFDHQSGKGVVQETQP